MQAVKQTLNKVLGIICIVLFMFMTCLGTYQIITRYVFNAPSTISEELLTFTFTWMALLAATLVFGKREHMRMSFFADKFKGKSSIILSIISEVLVLGFAGLVMVFGGIAITQLTITQVTASLGVPMAYVYVIVPICGVLTVIYSIINIMELVGQLKKEQE